MLSKVRHYVPKEELKSIYHSIFSSHMIYGSQIWGQGCTENIQKLQNRALRTIEFKNKHTDVDPLYAQTRILKLKDYIKLQNCLLIHQYLNDRLPECFNGYYHQLHSTYLLETRNSKLGCLFQPRKNTTAYGLNSISHQSIITWNQMTKMYKTDLSTLSLHELKNKLTDTFMTQYDPSYQRRPNNHNNNNNNNNHNNGNNNNYRNRRHNLLVRNNYYGQLRHDRPRPRFESRWDEGPNHLI